MTTLRLTRELELDNSWDVIVAGGGPAGCAAAIAAAREGAKTLLLEATGALGGMGTSGLVPAWTCFSTTEGEPLVYRGLAKTIFEASKDTTYRMSATRTNWVTIDAEALKRIYDAMVIEAGAEILFHTQLASVETDSSGGVTSVITANKSGLAAYGAKVFIDCTGDADLAVWAGADSEKGDENGTMQPVTHCCIVSNVDTEALAASPSMHHSNPNSPGWDMAQDDEFPLIRDCGICTHVVGPRTIGFNALHQWRVDNTIPSSTGHGLITGRQQADQFHRALKKYLPDAFADSHLVTTGALLGVRETRRIIGDYILTFDDYKARKSFPDEVLRNCQMVDIHPSEAEMPEAIKNRHARRQQRLAHVEAGELILVEHEHVVDLLLQFECRGEARDPGPDDDRPDFGCAHVRPSC